ncbi:T9SS type A sorting domain-containing protein [Paracrocinitomix mangrovi]|uniref:T9SS type A sorting domain-containing protein n=1 Tax=Paracrocinitomix mangrovi TaxID=2862509 RepID=UPI001C8D7A70|nr:T9SS type A sorting domain-containing protein [Paracrocinitomix mangrovi]UKN00971.1 T9SS type A sorting domain-containing protein [Paracrocinitomix mangrovi]
MNKNLLLLSILSFALNMGHSQCNPTKTKMMVIGDSWAFFSWTGDSYNENLDNFGLSDIDCFSNTTFAVNGSEASNYFDDAARVQALTDYINGNPDLEYVHMSLGGNDALGTWNINYTAAQTDSLLEVIMLDIKNGVDLIHAVNPNLKVLISGYDYPNFDETISTLNSVLQPFHPYYNMWDAMGQPNAEQLNGVLEDATMKFEQYAAIWNNVYFVDNLGLMQFHYGQNTALQTPPYGTYPPQSVTVPGGLINYPSPLDALNFGGQDSFHLNDDAYEVFVSRHFSEFYWYQLRAPHQTIYASESTKNGYTSSAAAGSDMVKVGNDNFEQQSAILHFNTAPMDDTYQLVRASIFIKRDSLNGSNLTAEDLTLAIKSGNFGATDSPEVDDYSDNGDFQAVACTYGSLNADGNYLRIDVPTDMFQYFNTTGTTEFKLAYTISDSTRILGFENIGDDILMDLEYTQNPFATVSDLKTEDLKLYPNPTKDVLNIQAANKFTNARIYNTSGQLVKNMTLQGTAIDVQDLKSGIYIIELVNGDEVSRSRFVKE